MRFAALVLLAALLAPALPVAAEPPNFVCERRVVETGSVLVIVVHNRPGPPGPATCEPFVTVCVDGECRTTPLP